MNFTDRLKHAWDAFQQREPPYQDYGPTAYGPRSPQYAQHATNAKRSTLNTIFNKIAIDVSLVRLEHVKKNEDGYYVETVQDGLNNVLTLSANLDQTGEAFIRDLVMSMFDEGVVAVVPTLATLNPMETQSYDVLSMRVGKIVAWKKTHVVVEVFDEKTLIRKNMLWPKSSVGIIENPFYAMMNEPNSTLQRLLNTLNNIDQLDRRQAAGKLDLILQFPYSIRTDIKRKEAEKRISQLEDQLRDRELGIGYIDASEKVIQLGRSLENNLWNQAQDLTDQLFNQIGMPKSIFEGTASAEEKLTYYNSTIVPILSAISQELTRKFISKTSRTQGHSIDFFQDIFKQIPVTQVAEIVDKMTRNEIMTPNEVRMKLGLKPSDDPKANDLRNRNLNQNGSEQDPSMLPGMDELGLDDSIDSL